MFYHNNIQIFLAIVAAILIVFTTTTVASFLKANNHVPFENYEIGVSYNLEDHSMVADGYYDRFIRCNLTSFNILLTHDAVNVTHYLTKRNLKVAPIGAADPGEKLAVRMELYLPEDIQNGYWSVSFHGDYTCTVGLITVKKTQGLLTPSFLIDRD